MANIRKYILNIANDQLNTILTKVQQGESGADDLFLQHSLSGCRKVL